VRASLSGNADALEDAGCTDRSILGCWVVDLILGKQ
jgi:hypothetical protein